MTIPTNIFNSLEPRPYSEIRDEIRQGDIVLFSQRDGMSRLIELATRSPFSHIGFVIRLEQIDRVMLLEALTSGVTSAALSVVVNGNGSGAQKPFKGGLVLARHDDFAMLVTDEKLREVSEFAFDRFGAPYAKIELLKIAARIIAGRLDIKMPKILAPADEYICSEYVAACYERVGIAIPWDQLGFLAPADFAADPKIRPIAVIANAT